MNRKNEHYREKYIHGQMTVSKGLKKRSNHQVEKKRLEDSGIDAWKKILLSGQNNLKGSDRTTLSDFVELCTHRILDNSRIVRYMRLF